MPRYNDEVKADALKKISEIGVQKTHEETGINIQTLYKWRREVKPALKMDAQEDANPDQHKIAELLNAQASLAEQLEASQQENAKLSQALADANAKRAEEAAAHKKQIKTMQKVIEMLMKG